jgi:hypothetical protein
MKMNACEGLRVLDVKIMVWDVKLCDQVFYILTMWAGISSEAVIPFQTYSLYHVPEDH